MSLQETTQRKVAVVTGAARGIGAGIAMRLAHDHYNVAAVDLDAEDCVQTVRDIESAGASAIAVSADVSDESAVEAAVKRIADELGAPTVLVNNAGVTRDHILYKMTVSDWDTVCAVHLRGAFLMAREIQPHMQEANWGRIINLSSTAAVGNIGQANYSAAKAGLQGLTKTLALELGRFNITVNAVAPGFTITAMTQATAERIGVPFEQLEQDFAQKIPMGRAGQPEDIAQAVAFFADERSGFISGQVLYVAGGPCD